MKISQHRASLDSPDFPYKAIYTYPSRFFHSNCRSVPLDSSDRVDKGFHSRSPVLDAMDISHASTGNKTVDQHRESRP